MWTWARHVVSYIDGSELQGRFRPHVPPPSSQRAGPVSWASGRHEAPHLSRTSHRPTHPGTNCLLRTEMVGAWGATPRIQGVSRTSPRGPRGWSTLQLPEQESQEAWSCWSGVLAAPWASVISPVNPQVQRAQGSCRD